MARRNYFDILGLDFDPAESNKKKIEAAIARWKAVKENELNNATDMGIRQALHDELAMEKTSGMCCLRPRPVIRKLPR